MHALDWLLQLTLASTINFGLRLTLVLALRLARTLSIMPMVKLHFGNSWTPRAQVLEDSYTTLITLLSYTTATSCYLKRPKSILKGSF